MTEIEELKKRIEELEKENTVMYAAIYEASTLESGARLRCAVELQRIARNDAMKQAIDKIGKTDL